MSITIEVTQGASISLDPTIITLESGAGVGPTGATGATGEIGATGATGATGPAGSDATVTAANIGAAIAGADVVTTPADSDTIAVEVSGVVKKWSITNLLARIKTYCDTLYALIQSRDDHGTISTGSEEISGNFTDHTLTTAGDHTWTFANFSESKSSFAMKLIVSSGTPTITLTTWTIATDSAQTISTMAAGTYIVVGKTFDGGTSGQITVIDSI